MASRNTPTRNALDSIPSLRRGNCKVIGSIVKGRAKKYRQESRMGRFQKNANETKATYMINLELGELDRKDNER